MCQLKNRKKKYCKKSSLLSLIITFIFAVNIQAQAVQKSEQKSTEQTSSNDEKKSSKLTISGYIQSQFQVSQLDSMGKSTYYMRSNSPISKSENNYINRFSIRRGRLKATYQSKENIGVLEFEMRDKGISLRNAYLHVFDPSKGVFGIKSGIFDRPFGYELKYSSSRLESPERSMVIQKLMPNESDLGASLTFKAPKISKLNGLYVEAGLFAGNSISPDTDSKKDFIGQINFSKTISKSKLGLGISHYNGAIFQPTSNVYTISNNAFVLNNNPNNEFNFAKRQYWGIDFQYAIKTKFGNTSLRSEYIYGTQPGSDISTNSPTSTAVVKGDTYIRNFNGGYVNFAHHIYNTKHSISIKYDWLDQNSDIDGNAIGVINSNTGLADVFYKTLAFGYMYHYNANTYFMAYYDLTSNEKTKLTGYFESKPLSVLTLRIQLKF